MALAEKKLEVGVLPAILVLWTMAMAMGLGPALGPAWQEAMPLSHGHVPMVPMDVNPFSAPSGAIGGMRGGFSPSAKSTQTHELSVSGGGPCHSERRLAAASSDSSLRFPAILLETMSL